MQLFRFGIKNVWVFQTSVVLGRDKLHVQHSALVYNDSEWINSMKYISTPVLSLLSRTEQWKTCNNWLRCSQSAQKQLVE